jgi:hypothetical protein
MKDERDKLSDLLARVEAGRFDELSDDEVTWLEQRVNDHPSLLAGRRAAFSDARERTWIEALNSAGPSHVEWEAMWRAIEDGVDRSPSQSPERERAGRAPYGEDPSLTVGALLGARPRGAMTGVRVWRGVAAIAACVALTVVWRFSGGARSTPPAWDLQLANHVDVQTLEVYGDALSAINYSGENGGPLVIWVFEAQEGV